MNDNFLDGNSGHKYIKYTAECSENKIYSLLAKLVIFISLHSKATLSIFSEKYFKLLFEEEVSFDESDCNLLNDKDQKILEKVQPTYFLISVNFQIFLGEK